MAKRVRIQLGQPVGLSLTPELTIQPGQTIGLKLSAEESHGRSVVAQNLLAG